MKIILLILLLGQFAPQQKPCLGHQINHDSSLSDDLVGCWLMNEGAGNTVYDLSGDNNTGTFGGSPVWVGGNHGTAIEFGSSSDYVVFDNESNFDFEYNQRFSISVWFNVAGDALLVSKQESTAPYRGYSIGHFPSSSFLQFVLQNDNSPNYKVDVQFTYTDVSVWNHLAVVSRGTGTAAGISMYLNGIEQTLSTNSDTLGGRTILNAVALQTMGRNGIGNPGKVDNVLIYDRILTGTEIALLYREPFCIYKQDKLPMLQVATQAAPSIVPTPYYYVSAIILIIPLSFIFLGKGKCAA